MTNPRKPIVVGNWKMYKTVQESVATARQLLELLGQLPKADADKIEVGIAPTSLALASVQRDVGSSKLIVAGQNCHFEREGAFTGEIAPVMLKDIGCSHVIIGHSERRQYFGETDETVAKKLTAAFAAGLTPILCVGEELRMREAGKTFEILEKQLDTAIAPLSMDQGKQLVVAYEPVWAIGTGKTATSAQAEEAHAFLRTRLAAKFGSVADSIRIQYGGSVKPDNIEELASKPNVDGALVGGASLKADSFIAIVKGCVSGHAKRG
jgi:triosephosphate isomerase (TIM)